MGTTTQPPGAASATGVADQLRAVERSLRQAGEQLGMGGEAQPNFAQARTAVQAGQEVLGRVPQDHQGAGGFGAARRELAEALQALGGDQPDRQRAATQLREAADSMAALMPGMGGTAAASAGTAMGQTQVQVEQRAPQIAVQQQPPQITVNQPPPQVTIVQPPPQVTINQPEPRVTVQQAQPQVRVEQAQPQVTVQQQGQPQVTMQQTGQPQVRMEGQDRQNQAGLQDRSLQGQAPAVANAQSGAMAPGAAGGAANVQRTTTSPAAAMSREDAQRLIGTNVVGRNGRDAGEVRNLVLDASGQVRGAVVEWGGFLGLGTREAIVPLDRITMQAGNGRAELAMTREELEALPRFESNRLAEQGRTQGWGDNLRLAR